jgi:DNA-directed RNA polymerase subunit RPC12/RpoP
MTREVHRSTILMRACPRCAGDLYRDLLEQDEEYVCLQCGRRAAKVQLSPEVQERIAERRVRTPV